MLGKIQGNALIMESFASPIIITDSRYPLHMTGRGHPECPDRHTSIDTALKRSGLLTPETYQSPREATKQELSLCHPQTYINLVQEEVSEANIWGYSTLSTGDVKICPKSYFVATLAAGGVLAGVDLVMKNSVKRVFCNIRPPGHHACSEVGMGFCLFNNVAIGAKYAQEKYGVERVLIVDWDVHHGNGTQDIFYDDPSVFYFSTHQKGIYPQTGLDDETGSEGAKGTTLNVPIPGGKGSRAAVIQAFDDQLSSAMEDFKPQLIMISSGFDGHKDDPIGGFDLETEDFALLTEKVCSLANKHCMGKIVSVLEGGYNLSAIAESAVAHVKAMRRS